MVRMYRLLLTLIVAASLLWIAPVYADEPDKIRVVVDGMPMEFDVSPIIENGRVLVPVRGIMEQLGADVDFDHNSREVTVAMDRLTLRMTLDQKEVGINGLTEYLEAPPAVVNGRLLLPLRFISEYFGYDVAWDGEERLVSIREKSEAFRLLYRAYLERYDVPFVTVDSKEDGLVLYEPHWTEPFSFSGLYEFRVGQGDEESVVNGERTGRWIDGKYAHKTQGFLKEQGEAGQIHSEFVQDTSSGIAYRDEGDGFTSHALYDSFQLDEHSGFAQYLLAFLMLNHEEVEIRTERIEGRSKKVLSFSGELRSIHPGHPLARIFESYLVDGIDAESAVQADISVRLDAETLRIENTDADITLASEQLSGGYTAIYHYAYDHIVPIDAVEASGASAP